jgi:hypothetical protein
VASCENSSLDIARDLIASGADLKVIDDWTGCSVLQLARRRGLLALAKLLEEAGA